MKKYVYFACALNCSPLVLNSLFWAADRFCLVKTCTREWMLEKIEQSLAPSFDLEKTQKAGHLTELRNYSLNAHAYCYYEKKFPILFGFRWLKYNKSLNVRKNNSENCWAMAVETFPAPCTPLIQNEILRQLRDEITRISLTRDFAQ